MSIQLVTYANQTVTPTNDAIIYEKAVDQNGIFYGCNVTVTSNNVNITGGYGLVCGREFVINSESIAVTLAPSGTLDGRLYVRLDLADADAPIQLLTATGNTLPPLVQDDDVNYTNGVYEMELATFTVGVSSLSDVVETFETIIGGKLAQKVDYIVEEGTETIWTYRKWNSGIVECWGTTVSASKAVTTKYGNGWYASQDTIGFPVGLFNSIKSVQVELIDVGGAGCWFDVKTISVNAVTGYVYSIISNTSSFQYSIFAKGTWK